VNLLKRDEESTHSRGPDEPVLPNGNAESSALSDDEDETITEV
jgi:hypothetical protein